MQTIALAADRLLEVRSPTPRHLPGKGPRFLPLPIKVQPSDKTAADWVAEGRR